METAFTDRTWQSPDGLKLHYRDYPAAGSEIDAGRPPILCLHGLTRNARDFEDLAPHIAAQGWRVIAPDVRGRGESEYAAQSTSYAVPTYIADLLALLDQEGIERFAAVGTSMGGLITIGLAMLSPERICGAVLNDIGPEVEAGGIDKIRTYVGQGRSFPTWMHAARELSDVHGGSHPGFEIADWLTMAKRSLTVCSNGRIAFDYDMKIAEPFMTADDNAVPPDLWPGFEALAAKPLLLVRGELSSLLSEATLAEMQRRAPAAFAVTVPNTGHAPTLDEPEARAAIDAWLARIG